jgi:hypothetical protein
MKPIKKYDDFIKETDVVGHDEINATKPTALSEKLCEKVMEFIDLARGEAKTWHDDENKDHTAEGYATECDTYMKECMESLVRECGEMMSDTMNRSDGGMRQGDIQDVPAISGAVR